MANTVPSISICILSYNRPETLLRLLRTIDIKDRLDEIEIVICEDHSPRQAEIRKTANDFATSQKIKVVYHENVKNLGYDGTYCELVKLANGRWLIFMGDDDEFVPGALAQVRDFLQKNDQLGYVMKSHYLIHNNGEKEVFKYFKETIFFPVGEETYTTLYRRSVFIAGFMIRRDLALKYLTDRFDGTLLIQLYLLAEVVLNYPSAYLDLPFTQQYISLDHNKKDVMFDREKNQFIARKPTLDISLKFLDSFALISKFIDDKYSINSTAKIKKDMSKYFYPSLAVHRNSGLMFFINYVKQLNKLGFNVTVYYYIYVVMLVIFGKDICDWGIFKIKKILGRTPVL